jgi:hypothetical protein
MKADHGLLSQVLVSQLTQSVMTLSVLLFGGVTERFLLGVATRPTGL